MGAETRANKTFAAKAVLPAVEQRAFAEKVGRRHEVHNGLSEFAQRVNLGIRLAKEVSNRIADKLPIVREAHEEPQLAHHNGPHAHRVEYTLRALILRTTSREQQKRMKKHPEILYGAFLFPRGHDFWHQVLTGYRNLVEGTKISSKQGHDIAAGAIIRAQTKEYAQALTEVNRVPNKHLMGGPDPEGTTSIFGGPDPITKTSGMGVEDHRTTLFQAPSVVDSQTSSLMGQQDPLKEKTIFGGPDPVGTRMSDEIAHRQAEITGIIAQIISAPHGLPKNYEKVLGSKNRKAYLWNVDQNTGKLVKVPRQYDTEFQAASLTKEYRDGNLDPFSLNQAQMLAIMTYELTHPNKGAADEVKMRNYRYGESPDGLHPAMQDRYGGILGEMAKDQRPFEDILGKEIMEQRDLIEHMGKLALLADTFDLVADPKGRVIRSLLTQKTFTQDGEGRPIWPKNMTSDDVDAMLAYVETGNGNNLKASSENDPIYSLMQRLDWEVRHWYPYEDQFHPEIQQLIGEISIMAQLEHFKIIREWMSPEKADWTKTLEAFYKDRIETYDAKREGRADRDDITLNSDWIRAEMEEVRETLDGLPYAGKYDGRDFATFNRYAELSIEKLREHYGISHEQMDKLITMSRHGINYDSPFIKEMYDLVYTQGSIPARGIPKSSALVSV